MPTIDSLNTARAGACVTIDGGEESIEVLLSAIGGALADLAPGQLIEVTSAHPDALAQLPRWCQQSGHSLRRLVWTHDRSHYWIERGEESDDRQTDVMST